MALFIFTKNSDGVENSLLAIAPSQSHYDTHSNFQDHEVDIVTVSQEDYDAVRLNEKNVVSKNGSSVNMVDEMYRYAYQNQIQDAINEKTKQFDKWIAKNTSSSVYSNVLAFNNYLRGIDVSTMLTEPSASATFDNDTLQWSDGSPLTTSIEKWCESQGQTAINFLELF
jgi:hypothetical protein